MPAVGLADRSVERLLMQVIDAPAVLSARVPRGEPRPARRRTVSAAVMERHDLDVEMVQTALDVDVLDARVGELHVPVGVRQVMLVGPFPNLRLVAVGPAVAIGAATVPLLEELL